MMMMMILHKTLLLSALLFAFSDAFSTGVGNSNAASIFAVTTAAVPAAYAAKEIDPALKGTKQDPEYQNCISTCMYNCTKPKGGETKLRQECLPECKTKCATTKQQLYTGSP